ncbi:MAG: hypothetical protein ACOYOV_14245 [Bacteroidales bacterium]
MAGNINEFKSSFKTDLARPARFDVLIPIPVALASYITTARNLSMRCEAVDMPGRSFETAIKKIGSAPVEKFPYHTTYNESTFTFIISDDMNEKIFFDAWMDLINPSTDYNFQYKANYATDISINQYDVTNSLTYSAVLREAFPLTINQLDMDWSADGFHKLSVVFAYKQWNNNTISALGQSLKNAALTGLINDVTGI